MPAPQWLARVNRAVTNHITGPLAPHLPGFGVVVHTGRRLHRRYRTPVNVFPHGDRYIVALTYGAGSEWVKNVLASGGCTLETRGRRLRLSQPRLFHDEQRRAMPAPVRVVLGVLNVSDFLELRVENGATERESQRSAG
ncbi:MAG: nitroreductase family deazaflavin-dependent oxidoreductase [Dehalococcoidia bacterium]